MSKASNANKKATAVTAPVEMEKTMTLSATDTSAFSANVKFISDRKPIELKPLVIDSQVKFFPFLSLPETVTLPVDRLYHVIYNNTLYILAGESVVDIDRPAYSGPNAIQYIDHAINEQLYQSSVIVLDGTFQLFSDNDIYGHNTIVSSALFAEKKLALTNVQLVGANVKGGRVTMTDSRVNQSLLGGNNIMVEHSNIKDSHIFSDVDLTITSTRLVKDVKIGLSNECYLDSIHIQSSTPITGEHNDFNFMLMKKERHLRNEITINRRNDFSPISSTFGKLFPTARGGEAGMFVREHFYPHSIAGKFTDHDKQNTADLLFGTHTPLNNLTSNQTAELNDFIRLIESRLMMHQVVINALR